MRAPPLLLHALLALALGASAQRAVLESGSGISGALTAAGVAASGRVATIVPSDGPVASLPRRELAAAEQHDAQLIGDQAGASGRESSAADSIAQPTEEELAAAVLFQHPLAPPEQQRNWRAGAQTHVEMQRWLRSFFASGASRLTSTHLQAAQTAAMASSGRGPIPLQVGEAGDVLATAGVHPCNATCARRAAEALLVAGEAPGHGYMPLVWPQLPEDRRRWAAVRDAEKGITGSGSSEPVLGSSSALEHAATAANGSSAIMANASGAAASMSSTDATATVTAPACLPRQPEETISKEYLVVAAVGNDVPTINRWLSMPESATFDLVLLHYGSGQPPSCPHCRAIVRTAGPKWQLVWQLTQQPIWPQLLAGKKAVMLPDDDVILDTCAINRAFELFTAYGLLLGQPSLCPVEHRPSWYLHLVQQPQFTLRFVTMVEIMAPIFDAEFFQGFVRPSLWDAFTGWGLDFVWPFLLQYPRDRVGVIDEVCMTHPHSAQNKQGDGSIYAALAKVAPYDAREEEARRDAQFDYYPSSCHALGFGYRPLEIVGEVPDPFYVPSPLPASPPAEQLPVSPEAASPRQRLEVASEHLRRHLLDVQPPVLYIQVAVAAAVAGLLLWHSGKRRPGSPWLSPRGGLTRQSPLPVHCVRSPGASPVKSTR